MPGLEGCSDGATGAGNRSPAEYPSLRPLYSRGVTLPAAQPKSDRTDKSAYVPPVGPGSKSVAPTGTFRELPHGLVPKSGR